MAFACLTMAHLVVIHTFVPECLPHAGEMQVRLRMPLLHFLKTGKWELAHLLVNVKIFLGVTIMQIAVSLQFMLSAFVSC